MQRVRSLWLHFNKEILLRQRKEETEMRISVSELPILGRAANKNPQVTIAGNGQVSFSTAASKVLEGKNFLAYTNFDAKTRKFEMRGIEKIGEKGVKIGNEVFLPNEVQKIGFSKKTKQVYFAGAGLCQYKEIGYDYKSSGRQTFDAEVDVAKATVTFTFPKGKLAAKPVVKRERKAKAAAAAAGAANGAAKPAAQTVEQEETLELTE